VGILRRGVGVGYDDVSVVTNLSADHLGVDGIDTLDQLAEVKAVILRSGCGVRATLSVTSSAHRIGFAVILPLPGGQRWSGHSAFDVPRRQTWVEYSDQTLASRLKTGNAGSEGVAIPIGHLKTRDLDM
jgi:UDP-N-acetylmuramyl tripeptide synthase